MPSRPRPDEMLYRLAAILSVQSLDLRAEYEAKLRTLTMIQRHIEQLRVPTATAAQREKAMRELKKHFDALSEANRDASETLTNVRAEFDRFVGQSAMMSVK
jgi:transcriptional regulator with GAF, ATPase, and Fis domain